MVEAALAWIVVGAIGAGFVGLMIFANRRQKRLRAERRRRWAAMGLGEAGVGGAGLGGAAYGGGCGGGGGGCGGGGCGGGGCGGGG
jgi:hypothetical protein